MTGAKNGRGIIAVVAWILCVPMCLRAATDVTIGIDTTAAGKPISPVFAGFSYETSLVLPDKDGNYYFRADNQPLLNLYKTLGIKHIRVGGNFSDKPTVPIPVIADIDSLFSFAHAAGVKVVYTIRLKGQPDASHMAPIAKYILDHYSANLDCFAIGNEPSIYYKNAYETYREVWGKFMQQIVAVAPAAMFCGPNTDRNYEWAVHFANDFGATGRIKEINEHAYVGLTARKWVSPDPDQNAKLNAEARDLMLSDNWVKLYQGVYDGFVPAVLGDKLPYRLEETNTFFNGGVKGASDTFTASLWALDYLYWWAEHDASGINFHTGDTVAAGQEVTPCRYAAYWSTPTGYEAHPVGYGIAAFSLGGHGNLLPTTVQSAPAIHLTAYAVAGDDGAIYLTIVNKEHGEAAQDAAVSITLPDKFTHGAESALVVAGGDIASTTGVTLGGASIADDGTWNGAWADLPAPPQAGHFTLTVPAASAAVFKFNAAP
jgi:hypothetical protein